MRGEAMADQPVTAVVRPTASLGAESAASFSRTRYPAWDPEPTVQVPAPVLESGLVDADVDGVGELSANFCGDEPAKTTK